MVALLAIAVLAQDRPSLEDHKKAKADEAAEKAAAGADEAKMAAVNKVVTMLEDLQKQVLAEGEKEAQTYNKFGCFCKDTTSEKTDAIQRGTDEVASLSATIESLAEERNELDTKISDTLASITEHENEVKNTENTRKEDLGVYEKNAADLSGAISALEGAIKALKASGKPSLVQLQSVSQTLQHAMMMADAMGLGGAKVQKALSAFLQQAPDVPMEDYKFHSGDIIDTLEVLLKDFRTEKVTVDEEEVKSVATHDAKMQEETDIIKQKNVELDTAKKSKSHKQEQISENSQLRSVSAATLLDDQKYLMELSQMCADKATTWDQRSKVRQDELAALTEAMGIIKTTVSEKTQSSTIRFAQQHVTVRLAEAVAANPDKMEAIEAEAEAAEGPLAFLQLKSSAFLARKDQPGDGGRQAVIDLLRTSGDKLHSTLLSALANTVSRDPFEKIKVLIQELIERLLKEAANESNQKGWCDKATADAEQKRDYSAREVEQLNGQMAELEALRDSLAEEISTLESEIADLDSRREEAEQMRSDEKAQNEVTVTEADAGLGAVSQAVDILDKFYKTVAKETVSLIQHKKGPEDDMPDAGFDNNEAYKGAQAESGGIIGMMEVIKSDFERTISETEKAEAQAEQDHLKFMTETGISLAEKTTAKTQKTAEHEAAEESLQDDTENFGDRLKILNTAIKELLDLKPTCVDTGMSYEERVARREDEISALNKAHCILEAYAKYGPDGLSDAC
jgi:predicted  nucleic acid-binding Zn-ribbon protein